jgi:hypothetical protein
VRLDELGTATDVYGLLDDLGDPKVPVGTQPGPQFGCAGWLGLCVANCSFVVWGWCVVGGFCWCGVVCGVWLVGLGGGW